VNANENLLHHLKTSRWDTNLTNGEDWYHPELAECSAKLLQVAKTFKENEKQPDAYTTAMNSISEIYPAISRSRAQAIWNMRLPGLTTPET
jgi:hypothetical protein